MQLQQEQRSTASSLSDEPRLYPIPPQDIHLWWDVAEPFLERAAERSPKVDIEDVPGILFNESHQLWVAASHERVYGAVITHLREFPNGYKICRILMLGGDDFSEWGHLLSSIELWAKVELCDAVEMIGRKGWGRMFRDYAPVEYVYRKDLHDGLIR